MENTNTQPKKLTPTHKAAKLCLVMSLITIGAFFFLPIFKIGDIHSNVWMLPFTMGLDLTWTIIFAFLLYIIVLWVSIAMLVDTIKYLIRLSRYPHHWSMISITLSVMIHFILSIIMPVFIIIFPLGKRIVIDSASIMVEYSIGMHVMNFCLLISTVASIIAFYTEFNTKVQRKFLNLRTLPTIGVLLLVIAQQILLNSTISKMFDSNSTNISFYGIALLIITSAFAINILMRPMLYLCKERQNVVGEKFVFLAQFFVFIYSAAMMIFSKYSSISDRIYNEYTEIHGVFGPKTWTNEAEQKILEEWLEWFTPFIPALIAVVVLMVLPLVLAIIRDFLLKKHIQPHEELDVIYNGFMSIQLINAYNAEHKYRKKYPNQSFTIEDIMREQAGEKVIAKDNQAPSSTPKNIDEEMRILKKLYDDGIITKEEFEAKKKQILGL